MNISLWLLKKAKYEIIIILTVLGILIFLPIVTVAAFAASGISVVSNVLASINPVTHLVEVFDSKGNKVTELKLSTTWPTTGYISDEFGANEDFRIRLGYGPHTGIDIANERGLIGTPVTTFITGKVLQVHNVDDQNCGIYVKIDNYNGISSLYCHLSSTNTKVGAEVVPGDIIGYMGSTGASTGAHLHFQVMVFGLPVNPRTFMVGEPSRTY